MDIPVNQDLGIPLGGRINPAHIITIDSPRWGVVRSYMAGGFTQAITSLWSSEGEGLISGILNEGVQVVNQALTAAGGTDLNLNLISETRYRGRTERSMNIPLELQTREDPAWDVHAPLKRLYMMSLPRPIALGNAILTGPGPKVGLGDRNGDDIIVKVGNMFRMRGCAIDSITPNYSSENVRSSSLNGRLLPANANVTLSIKLGGGVYHTGRENQNYLSDFNMLYKNTSVETESQANDNRVLQSLIEETPGA